MATISMNASSHFALMEFRHPLTSKQATSTVRPVRAPWPDLKLGNYT